MVIRFEDVETDIETCIPIQVPVTVSLNFSSGIHIESKSKKARLLKNF